jgi:branched-chain amino acid transport system permease protein
MDWALLVQQILNGLILGSSYALVALGFTLVLGTLDLFNFAHGETIMVAAFAAFVSLTLFGLPLPLTFLVSAATGALAAGVVYLFSIRFVNKSYKLAPALSAVGVGLLMQIAVTRGFGTHQREVPDPARAAQFSVGGITISASQVLVVAVSLVMMMALHLLLTRMRIGKAIRALAESASTAALLGVNVERVTAITLLLSGVLAGIAAVLTSFTYATITPFIGLNLLLKGLTGMIIGGVGNVYGAMVGGIVVGLLETFTVGYWDATYQDVVVYGVMIAVLMFRPAGIFGVQVRTRA